MGRLNIQFNDPDGSPEEQSRQVNTAFQDTQNWANTLTSNLVANYKEEQGSSNLTNSSTNYSDLPGFNFNFTLNNNFLAQISFNLTLAGNGAIGLISNGQLVQEIFCYGSTSGVTNLVHNNVYTMRAGSNQVKLQWRSNGGLLTKYNSPTTPGLNNFQVLNFY